MRLRLPPALSMVCAAIHPIVIEPHLKDDAFLADVHAASNDPSTLHLWWLGQSGFLLQWNGHHVLCDPYLSDSLTRKYARTDKPHVRMTGRVVDPARLDFLRCVTASHAHTDHLDPETLDPLRRVNPYLHLLCPEAIRPLARERSGLPDERILGVDALDPHNGTGTEVTCPGLPEVRFIAVPAAHEVLERDAQGNMTCLGFILRMGPFTVYHSGDTVEYAWMVDLLRPQGIDVALLPINGRAPERRVAGNLWGHEAAQLAFSIGAGLVVPCHYDMFEFNTATPDALKEACERLGQPYCILRQGERASVQRTAGKAMNLS